MKRTITILAVMMAVLACSGPHYKPEQQAAIDYIRRAVGEDTKLVITSVSTVDSLTFAALREDCIDLFEYKKDGHDKLRGAFVTQKMRTNARRQEEKMQRCDEIIQALKALRLGDNAGKLVCYDVCVSGYAEKKKEIISFKDFLVCVTPDGKMLSTGSEKRGLHKGFGKFLPGYTDILRTFGDDGQDDRK